ncbi:spore germination protein [Fictibacillus phosphorivorans]|uniref:spore germination protein n=1 Tax=Fictibacillus phosphorivorans TaxID=1221500 RepID=UPI003CEC5345
MPAIVGSVSVNSISSGSVFHVGDVQTICPVSYAKTYAGAGSFNTGDNLRLENGYNVTFTQDSDVNDSNAAANF